MKQEVYAYKNNMDIVMNSSSGGAFTAIIDAIYSINENNYKDKCNPVVYGATYDSDFNVIHKAAYNKNECTSFRGSKYIKSNLNGVFENIEQELKHEKVILFSGTPCQVAALSQYLSSHQVNTKKLYLVDVICHGTSQPRVWEDYKKWIENKYNSKLISYSFRYKGNGKKNRMSYPAMAKFESGILKDNSQDVRIFTTLFLKNLIMSNGCYNCKFCSINRGSDLTIGDFWGIEKIAPDFNSKNGVSEILVNSEKGKEILDYIKKEAREKKEPVILSCVDNSFLLYQHNLHKPTPKPKEYEAFWREYEQQGFQYIISKYADYNAKGKLIFYIRRTLIRMGGREVIRKLKK